MPPHDNTGLQRKSTPMMAAPQIKITDEQIAQFRDEGFVLIENALDPFGLDRVRTAFEDAQRRTEPEWRAIGYMPFWVKKWEDRTPPDQIIDWANTPQRRQLMGIHAVHGRASWDRKDVAYLPEHAAMAAAKKF
jgi:hypothetical protein